MSEPESAVLTPPDTTSRDRDLLRTLIDTLPDSIYVKDADGRYILDNMAHMRHVGAASTGEIVGKTVFDLFPIELAERFHADDDAILRSGVPLHNREEPIVDEDGTRRWISTTKVPFRDTAGRVLGLVCLSRDISEEKHAKEDLTRALARLKEAHKNLRELQMQLIEAEKMKSIGRLAAGVAHEVKNPLAIITMGIDYLSQLDFGDDPSAKDILHEISLALDRADRVVRDLLDFSAPKPLDVAERDLNTVIDEALSLTRGIFTAKEIEIVRELAPDLPPLRIDREKISQVLANLLTNAADAVPHSGGRVTVRASARQLTGVGANIGDARSEVFRAGDLIVAAEIEDNGPGIPADKLENIFDPFFTTKPTGQGTGLGLTVSKTIMDLHGGVLTVANREGGGARATIMLKAASPR
jgi:PAS domain S-box-containing protein